MSLREEFVERASREGANVSALCREYEVGRRTGYRWLRRARAGEPLADRSRRPLHSSGRTPPQVEARVVALRREHPTWGGRKLARRLRDQGLQGVPAPSTVAAILRRHGLLDGPGADEPRAFIRFEHEHPNDLWQMDFKGHVPCGDGRCHPLTVLDDHSRYNVVLRACADERTDTVREALTAAFREHGLPRRIACDNGAPWGNGPGDRYTPLVVWLLRLGVTVSHSRPYHPQTLGKEERFHRTLKAEVLRTPLEDLADGEARFVRWRAVYNHERPHEALGGDVPASRYYPSLRRYPDRLPEPTYQPGDLVRKVQMGGALSVHGHTVRIPRAFRGQSVALRPTEDDGRFAVLFATVQIAEVDLTSSPRGVSHVPEHMAPISPV